MKPTKIHIRKADRWHQSFNEQAKCGRLVNRLSLTTVIDESTCRGCLDAAVRELAQAAVAVAQQSSAVA